MNDKQIQQLIEAILFWKGEPLSTKKLSELCNVEIGDIERNIRLLEVSLEDRGIVIIHKDNEVMIGSNPIASKIIEDITREELSKELSKAALETLSIVLFMSPIRRSSIDYIRGVNSQFSLRHLEMRGLIEKVISETDSRAYLYRPTFDALSFLGVKSVEEIPGFDSIREKLKEFSKEENKSTVQEVEVKQE